MSDNILLSVVHDCMFKAVMLDPELKDVLKELINTITEIPLSILENIKIENTEYTIENKKDKKMTSDIIVSVGNRYINIEMNNGYYPGVFNKNDAYLSKLKASMYNSSESYLDAHQVIQINFNNFTHFKHKKDIYKFMFREETTNELDEDSTIKYHVSLENVWKRCYNENIDKLTRFERFCLILKTDDKEYARRLAGDDELMEKLVDKIAKLSLDNKMIGLYNAEIEAEKVRKTMIKGAKLEGHEEGRKEGRKEGLKEGLKEGIEQEKVRMVKSLYKNSVSIDVIASSAEISVGEVKKILNLK